MTPEQPVPSTPLSPTPSWATRPERSGEAGQIREVLVAAFPTADEADLVDALREDPSAWIDGLSMVTLAEGQIVAHALLTRAVVGGEPVLAALPGADLYEVGEWGLRRTDYDDLELVRTWRSFLEAPQRFLRHLE